MCIYIMKRLQASGGQGMECGRVNENDPFGLVYLSA